MAGTASTADAMLSLASLIIYLMNLNEPEVFDWTSMRQLSRFIFFIKKENYVPSQIKQD